MHNTRRSDHRQRVSHGHHIQRESDRRYWRLAHADVDARDLECRPAGWVGRPSYHQIRLHTPKWISDQQCRGWYTWAVKRVEALRPDVALIGGAYIGLGPSGRSTSIGVISSLTKAIEPFAGRVVVLNDPPGQSRQPLDCLLAPNATMSSCSYTPSADQLALTSEMQSEAGFNGASFIDTTGWFCYENQCPMVIGHTIAYSDTGHITRDYALELGKPFRAAFERAIRQAKRRASRSVRPPPRQHHR